MIANQMAGLLRHPVNVLPASMGYKMMYHGSELIFLLSNGTSMFQVPVATQMYARKRLTGLQCLSKIKIRGSLLYYAHLSDFSQTSVVSD